MSFCVGQEVLYVVQDGEWRDGYYDDRYWIHTGHAVRFGRVVSAGDELVAVWPEEGRTMQFVPVADVFPNTDADRAGCRVGERNLETFGNPDGDE
jgi:hypothetical protein